MLIARSDPCLPSVPEWVAVSACLPVMTFEETLKRAFPALLTLPVLGIAYLQGTAIANLLASALVPVQPKEVRQRVPAPAVAAPAPSARPIIEHNPFDHSVDLHPKPPAPPPSASAESSTELDLSDPLHAEPCAGVRVEIVSEAQNPRQSVAVLQEAGESSGMARRVGDAIGDFRVEYIGFNRLEHSPAVWLSHEATLCQAVLFGDEPEKKAKTAAPRPSKAAKKSAAKATRRKAAALPDEIASRIEKVNEHEFDVDRSVVDEVLENKAQLMRGTRMIPRKDKDGEGSTIALFGVRPNTLLGTLGLQNGDRIEEINGFDISDPEKALQAYARLRSAESLKIEILRRGKPETIQLNLR